MGILKFIFNTYLFTFIFGVFVGFGFYSFAIHSRFEGLNGVLINKNAKNIVIYDTNTTKVINPEMYSDFIKPILDSNRTILFDVRPDAKMILVQF